MGITLLKKREKMGNNFKERATEQNMRYRDLVLLIIVVAVGAWALEVAGPPTEESVLKQQSTSEDRPKDAPLLTLAVTGDHRFDLTLTNPKGEQWEPAGFAQILVGEEVIEVNELSQLDEDTWSFHQSDLSEDAQSVLARSEGASLKVRLMVLDAEMKMSRAMRNFEVESAPIAWAVK